jgi:putative ABC transport system permease protein
MFRIMLQKVLHKKWMICSLLIGNILLIAIAVSHPMYQEATQKRMLLDEFTTYMEKNNDYPMQLNVTGRISYQNGQTEVDQVRSLINNAENNFGAKLQDKVRLRSLLASKATSLTIHDGVRKNQSIFVSNLSDLPNHVTMLRGRMYSDTVTEDGFIEAVISQSAMVDLNLLVGDEMEFHDLHLKDGNPVRIRVVGVYTDSDDKDLYWVNNPDTYSGNCMISGDIMSSSFLYEGADEYSIDEQWFLLFDYNKLLPKDVSSVIDKTKKALEQNNSFYVEMKSPNYLVLLSDYKTYEKQIRITLSILEIPVIILLCAFLFMISRQLLTMEENEIAVLKSRGASKNQIFTLYLMQSFLISFVSLLIGLPLGGFICKALGASSAFLEFANRRSLTIDYTPEVFLYGMLAVLLSIVMTIIPVLLQDKKSILSVKRKRNRQRKPLWQRAFLDFILLAISLYGFYSFRQREAELLKDVISGKALDPLLFLSSSLFILGAGFISLRVQSVIVKLLYRIRKNSWKPASYTSFLQLIRTRNSQSFIIVFLVLTVALGVFYTTVARTNLANAQRNKEYTIGADVVLEENWNDNTLYVGEVPGLPITYWEPDFEKFGQVAGVKAAAKVYHSDSTTARINQQDIPFTLLGIETKSFGESTDLKDGLLKYPYYTYLNVLSKNKDAILVSANFRNQLGLKIGETITYSTDATAASGNITGTIYGFFDYWPSYSPKSVKLLPDGSVEESDNYMIVSNLSQIQSAWGMHPYEVWINMGGNTDAVYDLIKNNDLKLSKFVDKTVEVENISLEPLFQGTNGILTMSFIIILLICSVGYLIYWTLSIRSRELQFGIFRAMGVTKKEILHMLVNEQLLTGFFAIVFGAVTGFLASRMYVPMIQIAYSGADRVLPMELITEKTDLYRLFAVIGVVFIVCLGILIRQVFRMKISQALKLGED